MSIVTFWNDSREQSGRTLSAVAVATNMAIERNSRILVISTSFDDPTLKNCFWGNENAKNTSLFGNSKAGNVAVENGIEGLSKLITSNKLEPNVITDYTKVVFKDRLEILNGFTYVLENDMETNLNQYRKMQDCYIELIKVANRYYDMVIVDLDRMLNPQLQEALLKLSDINIYVLSQKMESINKYNELKHRSEAFVGNKYIPVIGRYDRRFKYNVKNIARYLEEKRELHLVPLNLLYMEAAEEVRVADLFLKLKNIKDKTDENYIFMECIQNLTNTIYKRLQEMKMRLR